MGKKNGFLHYNKRHKKSHKGVTKVTLEEKSESIKEPGAFEFRHFGTNVPTTVSSRNLDLDNRKAESEISEYTATSTDSSWRMMSNSSTPSEDKGATDNSASLEIRDGALQNSVCKNSESTNNQQSSVQVFVRLRPLDDSSPDASSTRLRSLSVENDRQVLLCTRPSKGKEINGSKHLFTFAHVFPESTPQREVFEVSTLSLVEAVLTGHRACVITYGIPNTGKSYTLYGKATSGKHRGVIMRAMENMLGIVNSEKNAQVKYEVSTSFLQLYNEKFYDLLDPSASDGIKFLENGNFTTIEGATQLHVESVEDVSRQLRRSPNRMRDAGSRSHTVFIVRVFKEEMLVGGEHSGERVKVTEGEIKFVDLVGVERSVKHATYDSPAVGTAEAKTTKSLQLFASLVLSLSNDRNAVVPYRDSKLTRLLRNALGGDCMTRLIVTASPCANLAHETLSCLQFAQKACQMVNFPVVNVTEKYKDQQLSAEVDEKSRSSPHSKSSSSPQYKLPPIRSNSGHRPSISGEDSSVLLPDDKPSQDYRQQNASSKIDELNDIHALATSSSSGVYSSLSMEDRVKLSPENQHYLHNKAIELDNNVVSLPLLTSGAGAAGAGLLASQSSPTTTSKRGEVSNARPSKSPIPGNNRRSKRWQKSSRNSPSDYNSGTDFASTIQPAPDHVLNGNNSLHSHGSTLTPRTMSPSNSSPDNVTATEDRPCCSRCKEREEKIKSDYDRMILFSKKDRDEKQAKLEELQQEIKKLKLETVSMTQIRHLEEERSKEKTAKEIQTREIVRLETVIETLKAKMSGMVNSVEVTALQELRRKEHNDAEDLKLVIDDLKLKLKSGAESQKRDLSARNDTIKKMEREIIQLKREAVDKEKTLQDYKKQQEQKSASVSVEMQRLQARNDVIVAELNAKLLNSAKEVTRLKEAEMRNFKQLQDERGNFERELTLSKQNAAHAQAELKIAQGKLVSFEREHKIARSANHSSGISSMASRVSLRRSMDYRDTGTAMSDSLESDKDGACIACGKMFGRLDVSDPSRDEELRILLLQDAKNREVLIQLKRERNLLCDVMKIMYCRQWFVEEALPHAKRALRRVGVDTKALNTLRTRY